MNGAIELPQEASPLNQQTLFNILVWASSSNPQRVQTGSQQLQNWERQPGFYSGLQSVFIDTSLPTEVRYLSAIQLKNGIDKYWRKTAMNAISKEEKALIRSRSLESGVNEPDHRLALQNAIVIAKIMRFEFPHDWLVVFIFVYNSTFFPS
jgi:transcription termination factor NusB